MRAAPLLVLQRIGSADHASGPDIKILAPDLTGFPSPAFGEEKGAPGSDMLFLQQYSGFHAEMDILSDQKQNPKEIPAAAADTWTWGNHVDLELKWLKFRITGPLSYYVYDLDPRTGAVVSKTVAGKLYLAALNLLCDAAFDVGQSSGAARDAAHTALELLKATETNAPFGWDALQLGGSETGREQAAVSFLLHVMENVLVLKTDDEAEQKRMDGHMAKALAKKKSASVAFRVDVARARRYAPMLMRIQKQHAQNLPLQFLFPKDAPTCGGQAQACASSGGTGGGRPTRSQLGRSMTEQKQWRNALKELSSIVFSKKKFTTSKSIVPEDLFYGLGLESKLRDLVLVKSEIFIETRDTLVNGNGGLVPVEEGNERRWGRVNSPGEDGRKAGEFRGEYWSNKFLTALQKKIDENVTAQNTYSREITQLEGAVIKSRQEIDALKEFKNNVIPLATELAEKLKNRIKESRVTHQAGEQDQASEDALASLDRQSQKITELVKMLPPAIREREDFGALKVLKLLEDVGVDDQKIIDALENLRPQSDGVLSRLNRDADKHEMQKNGVVQKNENLKATMAKFELCENLLNERKGEMLAKLKIIMDDETLSFSLPEQLVKK